MSSIAPMELDLDLALTALRAVASLSTPTDLLTLKAVISMTTQRHGCARLLPFSSIAPLERYACSRGWQGGGGLHIDGTATLINTKVYSNQADDVCSP